MAEFTFKVNLQATKHGKGEYHFVTVPADVSDVLNELPIVRSGFKSIKCEARIGSSSWNTSVFPGEELFILLIAKKIMTRENIAAGDSVEVELIIS
jgi:hypothetical protein